MTVGELFGSVPIFGLVAFMVPDESDPKCFREETTVMFTPFERSPLPQRLASRTVRELSVRDADTIFVYCA